MIGVSAFQAITIYKPLSNVNHDSLESRFDPIFE